MKYGVEIIVIRTGQNKAQSLRVSVTLMYVVVHCQHIHRLLHNKQCHVVGDMCHDVDVLQHPRRK